MSEKTTVKPRLPPMTSNNPNGLTSSGVDGKNVAKVIDKEI